MSMIAVPLLFAALFWWLSTGVILWLVGLAPRRYKWIALGATAMLIGATMLLLDLRDDQTIMGAYAGFIVGVLSWAWHETMFLLGVISGPRKTPCPAALNIWPRFKAATQTVIHHEIAIAIHAGLIFAVSWNAANQIAAWTFALLWGMRLSAKFVVFLGAPRVAESFLPNHLAYLKTYFGKERPAQIFPLVMIAVTAVVIALGAVATQQPLGSFHSVSMVLLTALAALGALEHWALALPLPDKALWAWAMSHRRQATGSSQPIIQTSAPTPKRIANSVNTPLPQRRSES